ncbi:MAG: DGQHR domain-containing protein [Armatimonadota bacterium]|nr:DGQHR domain-containing protein [Armatimonadota bacterium]
MRAFEVIRFTQLVEGQPTELYVTALPASVALGLFDVDVYDPGTNPEGYQRRPAESRFVRIARYVLRQEGLLPTAILVNVREPAEFQPHADGNVGLLKVPAGARLWVVDGQHRLYGLKRAQEDLRTSDPEAELEYDVPVVFTVGLDKYDEMRLFHIVNSQAKSVPTDLAAELLFRAVREEGKEFVHGKKGSEKDFRKAVGTAVARHLNSAPGPWQGKIRLPNERADRRQKPLQLNAVASSLEPALKDPGLRTYYESREEFEKEWPKLRGLVFTYWRALSELMPEAFADIENHSVQRTAGTYAFHMILPDVVYRCRERGDLSVEGFKAVLRHLDKWVQSETWHTKTGDPLTRSTGMSAIRELVDEMRDLLPPPATPGLEIPAEGRRSKDAVRKAAVVYGD